MPFEMHEVQLVSGRNNESVCYKSKTAEDDWVSPANGFKPIQRRVVSRLKWRVNRERSVQTHANFRPNHF